MLEKQKKKLWKRWFSVLLLVSGHFKDEYINRNYVVKCNNIQLNDLMTND